MGGGSHLKEYTYKYTGGTGKYEALTSGGGTLPMYENITDTLAGGTYRGQLVLPKSRADTIDGYIGCNSLEPKRIASLR